MVCIKEFFPHIHDKIFNNLSTEDLLNTGLTCKNLKHSTDDIYEKKGKISYFKYS